MFSYIGLYEYVYVDGTMESRFTHVMLRLKTGTGRLTTLTTPNILKERRAIMEVYDVKSPSTVWGL